MATAWVSVTSHRSRDRLRAAVSGLGPSYGIWPNGGRPRGEYYEIPAQLAGKAREIKGLRVLRGKPSGGRLFKHWTSAQMGGPIRGSWPVPHNDQPERGSGHEED